MAPVSWTLMCPLVAAITPPDGAAARRRSQWCWSGSPHQEVNVNPLPLAQLLNIFPGPGTVEVLPHSQGSAPSWSQTAAAGPARGRPRRNHIPIESYQSLLSPMEAAGKLPRFSDHVSWRFAPLYVLAGQRSTDSPGEFPLILSEFPSPPLFLLVFQHTLPSASAILWVPYSGPRAPYLAAGPRQGGFSWNPTCFAINVRRPPAAPAAPGWGSAENSRRWPPCRTCWSTSPKGCPP